mmetsp:Transcript_42436/g.51715  ORF Transcript_42436/g.51715 Transcript_42436/m.51715 type:complete len:366 (+) Transcript_42436:100-1197(+)|eukprot:CAMPEP_0172498412 /NCGR_PEP_ID=MMETSP1066-20121228/113414_1 /TAXON_ID=671091 /ORGANISM="Coscinodiscus wailesii, Strain CCMP2513" /LENGTH=365 /DNA_ID=CAMNT_0013271685 /DNA_START=88 /DNA_END=1185 /DNA_ORIENTATION=-
MHFSANIIIFPVILPVIFARHQSGYTGSSKQNRKYNRKHVRGLKLDSKAITVADLSVKISGKSGSVSISRDKMGKKKDKKSNVKITIDSLREIALNGDIVGEKGNEKHSVQSFTNKDFTFLVEDTDITLTEPRDDNNSDNSTTTNVFSNTKNDTASGITKDALVTTAQGVNISFSTSLDTGSEMDVYTYFFSKAGEVGTVTEKWAVQPGDMKFNIGLKNWVWCDPCPDGTGAFVELDIEIKGEKNKPQPKPKKNETTKPDPKEPKKGKGLEKTWDLGSGATLDLSDLVMVDGNWTNMPEGYPKLVMKGDKQMYTFRFPRFNDHAFYDPIVKFDPNAYDDASLASSVGLTFGAAFMTGSLTFLMFC